MAYTTINKSSNYIKNLTYAGNGGTNNVTGVGFQPDFVWVKDREATKNHNLFNSASGTGKYLECDAGTEQQTATNVLTAFDDLDNPEDIALFEEYLIKNLALYFEKWEGELQNNVEPPAAAADAEPDEPLDAAGGEGDLVSDEEDSEEETEVPEFELEEVLNFFDLDDIIKHIL